MKIQTVSKLLVALIVCVNLVIMAIGFFWMKGYGRLESQWQEYSEVVERKTALLGLIKDSMGYGGMIHHMKNYLLRSQQDSLISAHQELHELRTALVSYGNQPISAQERQALQAIEKVAQQYFDSLVTAEKMKFEGELVLQIDKVVVVDDSEALAGLRNLNRAINRSRYQTIDDIAKQINAIDKSSTAIGIIIVVLLFSLAAYFYWFLKRRIVNPVNELLVAFESIDLAKNASARLPVPVARKRTELDELAHAGNRFLDVAEAHLTDLISAENQAREKEERMSAILNSTGEGIITIDRYGQIVSYNPKCQDIFGYLEDEVIGSNVSCLMRPHERDAHNQYLSNAKVVESRIINANRELWGQRKDGSTFPMELTVSRVKIEQQILYIGILHDISARKANELKLMNAKIEAEKANKAKSQFLSAMSHELRTPLNAILGFSQLLIFNRKEVLSETQKNNTEQILQAGKHLLELINDILDLSKIESGNFDIEFEQVELPQLLEECMVLVDNQAKEKGINVTVSSDLPEDNYLETNFVRLKQVLLNLLSNAIKYNVEGGSVEIRCEKINSERVRIAVKDTGVGIDEVHYDDVFEPFVRFDKRVAEIEGTGIGLSVCASLVAAMKGEIGFVSEKDKGSTFFVEVPLVHTGQPRKSSNERLTTELDEKLNYGDKTMLYVEDNQANMALMRVLVNQISNINFIEAFDAETGLEVVANNPVDIIFMDVNLPGMDGLEAVKRLRANPKSQDIPVIAVSAAASKEDVIVGTEAGFNAYLTKPLNIVEVTETIRNVLGGCGRHDSNQPVSLGD